MSLWEVQKLLGHDRPTTTVSYLATAHADPETASLAAAGPGGAAADDGQGEPAVKWNLRWAAARRDIWRPSDLLNAFEEVGFTPSLSKVAALWSGKPISVRLDDLDKICAALGCTVADLLEAEPLADAGEQEQEQRAAGAGGQPGGLAGHRHGRRVPPVAAAELTRAAHRGTGRSGSARSASAGASCASTPPARPAPNGDGPSPASRLPALRPCEPRQPRRAMPPLPADRSASTIPAGSSAQCPDGRSSSVPPPGVRRRRASSLLLPAQRKDTAHRRRDPRTIRPAASEWTLAPARQRRQRSRSRRTWSIPRSARSVRRPPRLELPDRRRT